MVEEREQALLSPGPGRAPRRTAGALVDDGTEGVARCDDLFLRHGVALSPGEQFGAPGFVRLNFGTQRARLRQALQRMTRALNSAG